MQNTINGISLYRKHMTIIAEAECVYIVFLESSKLENLSKVGTKTNLLVKYRFIAKNAFIC